MGNEELVKEVKIAWRLYQRLEELNSLLWDRYGEEFINFAMEGEDE